MSFSDKVAEKLIVSRGFSIMNEASDELYRIAESAYGGNEDSRKFLGELFDESWDKIQAMLEHENGIDAECWWENGVKAFIEKGREEINKNAATEKLQNIEAKILQFCTKPRTSSQIINLFPARPYNILAIVESLKRRGMINLAANRYVSDITHRDFQVTMQMQASKGPMIYRVASIYEGTDEETRKAQLESINLIAELVDEFSEKDWRELPDHIKASLEHVYLLSRKEASGEKEAVEEEEGASENVEIEREMTDELEKETPRGAKQEVGDIADSLIERWQVGETSLKEIHKEILKEYADIKDDLVDAVLERVDELYRSLEEIEEGEKE